MAGVDILAIEQVVNKSEFNGIDLIIGTLLAIIICVFIGLLIQDTVPRTEYIGIIITVFLIIELTITIIIGLAFPKNIEYELQYKVTVSDEVKMNEFMKRYEIIEQKGKIYTVREKEGDTE